MGKRIIEVLMIIAMLLPAALPAVQAQETGYCWVEAEDMAGEGFLPAQNPQASGGSLACIYQAAAPADDAYFLDMTFTLEQAGRYDIWILSCPGTSTAVSKFKWSINGSEPVRYSSTGETNSIVYEHSMPVQVGGIQQTVRQNIQWNRVAAGEALPAGDNVFSYIIDSKATTGTRSYLSMIDCLVVVPETFAWMPGENLDRPAAPPRALSWIELEDYENQDVCFATAESGEASGGKMLYAYNLQNETGEEQFTYTFTLDQTAEYDIWYLGCEATAEATHLSGMWWNIDQPADTTDPDQRSHAAQADSVTIMNSTGGDSNIPMYWQKLDTREIEAGTHTLNLTYRYRTLAGAENTFVTWADCAAIIPSEYQWSPPADPEAPDRFPAYDAARLDAQYIEKTYFSGDYTAIEADLDLPDKPLTPLGSTVTFRSGAPEVMSDQGQVTRPDFTGEDITFQFYIETTFGGVQSSLPVEMTVLKHPKYNITNFGVFDAAGQPVQTLADGAGYTAEATIRLNAGADCPVDGRAALIAVVYDETGAIAGAAMAQQAVTPEAQKICTALPAADYAAGYTLRVYLLNDFMLANQLAETLVIQ